MVCVGPLKSERRDEKLMGMVTGVAPAMDIVKLDAAGSAARLRTSKYFASLNVPLRVLYDWKMAFVNDAA